ncbi:MAG: ParB/RepB/Spo0J family partition protein [Holosporales bacterium]|jgi:ParB family chromosome partitioning protein|nr:ParB/RepB/Spo0J family partition protein [Holosporales bacterium]
MKGKLGRGLSALLGDSTVSDKSQTRAVSVDDIVPNESQPRKYFDEGALDELANSIKSHGILQPIVVRNVGEKFEIVAGERRWRAAKIAGLSDVPVHVVDCSDGDVMILAMVENLQRTDLNPIEEAEALKTLIESCGCRQEDLGEMLSKSRCHISNTMRLLALPESIRKMIKLGKLSAGHGRCLVGVYDAEFIAETAAREGWSVRQLEKFMHERMDNKVRDLAGGRQPVEEHVDDLKIGTMIDKSRDAESADIAYRIAARLKIDTKLKITQKGGVFTLTCKSCEELESLIEKLMSLEL